MNAVDGDDLASRAYFQLLELDGVIGVGVDEDIRVMPLIPVITALTEKKMALTRWRDHLRQNVTSLHFDFDGSSQLYDVVLLCRFMLPMNITIDNASVN